jgi:hypothetical protein
MLRPSRALPLALVPIALACGPAPVATPPPATPVAAAPLAVAAPAPIAPAPTHVEAGGMPTGLDVYAELPDVPGLLGAVDGKPGLGALPLALALAASELGIPAASADALLRSVKSVHVGAKHVGGELRGALSLALADATPLAKAIEAGIFERGGDVGDYGKKLVLKSEKGSQTLLWFEGPRLVVVGDEPMLQAVTGVVEGRTKPVSEAERGAPVLAADARRELWGFVAPALLAALGGGKVTFPAPVSAGYALWEGGYRGGWRALLGVPGRAATAPLPAPRGLALARRLPAETVGYVALSTTPESGRLTRADLVNAIAAWGGEPRVLEGADAALGAAGVRVDELAAALRGEGVAGVVVRNGPIKDGKIEHALAFVTVLEVGDVRPVERALAFARDAIGKEKQPNPKKKVTLKPEGSGFTITTSDPNMPFGRVHLVDGRLVAAFGQKDLVGRAFEAVEKGKKTLGDDAAHAHALSVLPGKATVRAWADLGRGLALAAMAVPEKERGAFAALRLPSEGPNRMTSGTSLRLLPEDDRLRVELDEVNGVGLLATTAVYGVRKYLANAKTAEAKNTVSAVARAAVMSYEREALGPGNTILHELCKSAVPVPAAIPRAMKYQPSAQAGHDYQTGDAKTGWRCLKFEMDSPQYYRYSYTVGGPYKGPAFGGPDPGPNGFEIAAEGDLDGDGETSLFTMTGRVDPKTQAVILAPSIFSHAESE